MDDRVTRLAAVAVAMLVAGACGGPQGGAPAASNLDTESPEYAAMQYRQGLMHVISYKASRVRGMADGEVPVDEAEFLRAATDLAAVSNMLDDAFPEGTDSAALAGASRAMPEIWGNWSDFVELRGDLQTAAEAVASQARAGGLAAARLSVERLASSCGACHRVYRQRAD